MCIGIETEFTQLYRTIHMQSWWPLPQRALQQAEVVVHHRMSCAQAVHIDQSRMWTRHHSEEATRQKHFLSSHQLFIVTYFHFSAIQRVSAALNYLGWFLFCLTFVKTAVCSFPQEMWLDFFVFR